MPSRRQFLAGTAGVLVAQAPGAAAPEASTCTEQQTLDGTWRFRLDDAHEPVLVTVPHTWQVSARTAEHYGTAFYERDFDVPREWAGGIVRIEFEAVFHSAAVSINGAAAGEHLRKGYTAFAFDITKLLRFGERNVVAVRVDNSFDDRMLPRGRSSDWAHDGGIYRPVRLLFTPKVFAERVEIDADPDLGSGSADVRVRLLVRNAGAAVATGAVALGVTEEKTGLVALNLPKAAQYSVKPGEAAMVEVPAAVIRNASLWHFDHPNLYRLRVRLESGHVLEETFGIRKIETRDCGFYLNGERVRLMGTERMAGSNPEFGMAEPSAWIHHDHADMKKLNCIYTRVHWQQDRRVLDYCDRHGILIQTEVPTWGGDTFKGMEHEPSATIMQNGLEQLHEMIARDRNHPCIFSWGVCNEVQGQNPPAYAFANRMYDEAKKLDPKRLVTYASNSLQSTPGKDVAGLMDYVMWNEYYESWYSGTPADLARNLEEVHQAFPSKAIVISEYGYCACNAERPEGDARRAEILRDHDHVFHQREYVAGLIFFCYNDYRTHIGDKGIGAAKQRTHGVVDLYGARKPSYELLRSESSPVESVTAKGKPGALNVVVRTRDTVPSYSLAGYKLRAVCYGFGDVPLERFEADLPSLAPGKETTVAVAFRERTMPVRVQLDVLRPTGFSAYTQTWKP